MNETYCVLRSDIVGCWLGEMESGGSTCWAKSSPTPTVLIVKWRDIGSDQVCTRTKASLLEKQTRRQQQSQIWAISMMKRRTV